MVTERHLSTARSAAERFSAQLSRAEVFDESLAREYKVAKQAFASAFQRLALADLNLDAYGLEDIKKSLESEMAGLFGGLVDSSLLRVGGYNSPHPLVYALLAENEGSPVPAWRLRMLTADATHTERRTRELRDLGFTIIIAGPQDDQTYALASATPDLTFGAAFQLRKNARSPGRLNEAERNHIVSLAEKTAKLP